jgi:hypothetical protein
MLYRVTFFKVLCDSTGHAKNCQQGIADVHANTPEEANITAKQLFATQRAVKDWTMRADATTVEVIPRTSHVAAVHRA